MDNQFDIIVIGSGPGGYTAAIRASQLGYKTAMVEKYASLGGTCTNVGCIPSKALLDATEHFHDAQSKFEGLGIEMSDLRLNTEELFKRKDDVVAQNVSGLNFLMKSKNVLVFKGIASFLNEHEISITGNDENLKLKSKYFIIATGSKPTSIPGVEIDKKRIITSTEALSLKQKPESMAIIGGGVIGVEMASIYARMGVNVTIIEFMDRLIPTMDSELGKELKRILTKQGIKVLVKHSVQSAKNIGEGVEIEYLNTKGEFEKLVADYCLVAVGRKPYTNDLGLERTSVTLDDKGRIEVNEKLQTKASNIYAIGDVIAGPMLAHKAEEDAVFVAETIDGQKPHLDYHLVPSVVYTWPEVASVGYTEEQLKEKGIDYRVGKFPFSASGRARAAGDTSGFSKVLTDTKYGEVLGVHIIGARAADLIGQAVIGMQYEVTHEDMFRISYAHPTYSETLKEAYLIASGQGSLNI